MHKVNNRQCITNISTKSMVANKKRNLILIVAIALTSVMLTTLFTVGGSIVKSMERATMYQVGTDAHAGFKFLTQEEYELLALDREIHDLSFNIIVGTIENAEVYEDYTEVRYTEELCAKQSFSMPTTGKLPEVFDEIATCTQVLDDFGLPHELGQVLHLKLTNGIQDYEGDFILCGFWEKPAATLANQVFVSKAFQEKFSPVWKDKTDENAFFAINSYAGSINPEFNFDSSLDIEGQMVQLKARLGFGDDVNDGVNWAYVASSVDPTSVILVVFLLVLIIGSGYLIIYNIFYIAVSSDIHYYGLLKTVGTTNRQLKKIVLRQAVILCIFAVPIGLILGYLISMGVIPLIAATMLSLPCTIYPDARIFVASAVFSWFTVRISCIKPCKIIQRISPVEAVRFHEYTGEKRKNKKTKRVTPIGMAMENLKRNKKKTVSVVLSIALSIIMINATVSIVASFDEELFLKAFAACDFTISDGSVLNVNNLEKNYCGIDEADMAYMRQTPGVTDLGAVYMSEAWHDFTGEALKKMQTLYEEHKDWYTYGSHDEWLNSLVYEDKKLPCHIYGVDQYPFGRIETDAGVLDWEKFESGKYAVISSPVEGMGQDEDYAFYKVGDMISVRMPDESVEEYEVMAIGDIPYAMGPEHGHGLDIYITISSVEYLKHCPEEQGALKLCFDVDEESLQAAEEYVADYCDYAKPQLGYDSRLKYEKDFDDMVNMFLLVGGALSFILALIGVLNFMNLTYTSIQERHAELTVLRSVGMTRKQMNQMLVGEGMLRIILTFAFVLTVGMGINYMVVNVIAGQMTMFRYRFVAWPMLLCIPIFLLISVVIPKIIIRTVKSI